MAANNDEEYSFLSSNSRRKKIAGQLARLDTALRILMRHLDTKPTNPEFAFISEFLRWLIRGNKIRGNTQISGLAAGAFRSAWIPQPKLDELTKLMDCSNTSIYNGQKYIGDDRYYEDYRYKKVRKIPWLFHPPT